MRMKNIKISSDELLIDEIFINDVPFIRYYHHSKTPTRYFASADGRIYSEISDCIMKPTTNQGGYFVIGIRFKNKGKPKYIQLHKIIATVFCGGYHKGMVIDHIDGNKKNNYSYNLEWVTSSMNTKRAYDIGLHNKYYGENNSAYKYTDKLVHLACQYIQDGKSIKETSKLTGISVSSLHSIVAGIIRVNISSKYTFPKNIRNGPNRPLSDETKRQIIHLYNQGMPAKEIQKSLGIDSLNRVIHAIYDDRYRK